MSSLEDYFNEVRKTFESELGDAQSISHAVGGKFVSNRLGWGTWVFTRMCAIGESVRILLEKYIDDDEYKSIDHLTIGSSCRNIIEAGVFLSYLIEPKISDEEWQLRKWTLDLHDCSSRIRLFRSTGVTEEVKKGKIIRTELQNRMSKSKLFLELPEHTRTSILAGSRIYVRGMRNALTAAGWDSDHWDGVYTYLSGSMHCSPISFYNEDKNQIDYVAIRPSQFGFAAFALEIAHKSLKNSSQRIQEELPN